MKVALYFGSFNPIHIGHLIIAKHVLNTCNVDKVWFVVSPQNPLKESSSLLAEQNRYYLTSLATENDPQFKVSNIEFGLPRPSYTMDTLAYLTEKHPKYDFTVLMGSDSYQNLPKWKNYEQLLERYKIIVFERPNHPVYELHTNATLLKDAPLLEISATMIRRLIKDKKSIKYLVPDQVIEEINKAGYYKV